MRYFLVAGEASGDLHASALIRALKAEDPEASFAFMGGDKMAAAAGILPVVHYRDVAFMGVVSVLKNYRTIRRRAERVQEALRAFAPDVVIPVDFADFNIRYILPLAQELAIPSVYYILPKLWAWRAGRIKQLRRYLSHALSILPFEVDYFRAQGLSVSYVGNPCVDAQLSYEAEHPEPIAREADLLALLPGSRKAELLENLPLMLQAAEAHLEAGGRVALAAAPGMTKEDYAPYLSAYPQVELVWGDSYGLMRRAARAAVTSGTATLETALAGCPLVVCYGMGGRRALRWIFEHCFRVRYVSLVNLILDRPAVPELLGDRLSAPELRRQLELLEEGQPARRAQLEAFAELSATLGRSYSAPRAARALIEQLQRQR